MSDELTVRHLGDDRFAVDVRGHTVLVDQPTGTGGADTGPTPTELFIAGLASCVAFYARRYLSRHEISPTGLAVSATYDISGRPARVTPIVIVITPPDALPPERRDGLLAVASHCTVHNTLTASPDIEMVLDLPVAAAT
jgi:putative redox protein